MAQFNPNQFRQQMQAAQRAYEQRVRQAQQQIDNYNRQVDQHNRRVAAEVNAHNRRVAAYNQQVGREVAARNRQVESLNHQSDVKNRQLVADTNRAINQLRSAATAPTYRPAEQDLVDRLRDAVAVLPQSTETDVFLSYARIDGATAATQLKDTLVEDHDVSVWFDAVSIKAGHSMARQMDEGLRKARAGVVLLTPAYLAGRFWTERELGVLLHKATVIPVLHGVTFEDVSEYSGILTDLAGFTTELDDLETIADKIAEAVRPDL